LKLRNLLFIMAAVFALIQIGINQRPDLSNAFNLAGLGAVIPLFFVLLASFKQARQDRVMWLWFVALAILAFVAFTLIRDWLPVLSQPVPPTPTPPFEDRIST
jgi:hypothetical protein